MSKFVLSFRYILFCFICCLFLCSCGSKLMNKNKEPEWISQGISDPYYYVGIGHVVKVKGMVNYADRANKLALQSLSEQISLRLKSSSVLVNIEKENVLTQDFSQIVMARATNDMEGYERFAVYETGDDYYVGYRLSKEVYAAQVAKKKEQAITLARRFYQQGVQSETEWQMVDAFLSYMRSMESLKGYMNEFIAVDATDSSNLMRASYKRATDILEHITFDTLQTKLVGKYGGSLKAPLCVVMCGDSVVKGIPVKVSYSELGSTYGTVESDSRGVVTVNLKKLRVKRITSTIEAEVDVEQLLSQANVDYVLRKWMLQHSYGSMSKTLTVCPSTIYVSVSERNLNAAMNDSLIMHALVPLLKEAGFEVTTDATACDYCLYVETNTERVGSNNGLYTSKFVGKYELKLPNGSPMIRKNFLSTTGTQLNYVLAGQKAYRQALAQLKSGVVYDVETAIVQL